MASRTQLRVQQLTGSIIDIAYSGSQTSAAQDSAIVDSHLGSLLGQIAGAIGRMSGGTGTGADSFTNKAEGVFTPSKFDVDTAGAITLDAADGQVISITHGGGSSIDVAAGGGMSIVGENTFDLDAAGAVTIDGASFTVGTDGDTAGVTLNSSAAVTIDAADGSALSITHGGGSSFDISDAGAVSLAGESGATVSIGSTAAQLAITTTTSGEIDITSAGALDLNAADGAALTITHGGGSEFAINASGQIDLSGESGAAVNIGATAAQLAITTTTSGEIDITSAGALDLNAADGSTLSITHGGGSDISMADAGAITITGENTVSIVSPNAFSIDARTASGTGAKITLGDDVGNSNFVIENNAETDQFTFTSAGDLTIGNDLTVSGDATVGGNLTITGDIAYQYVTSSVVEFNDPMIVFNALDTTSNAGQLVSSASFPNDGVELEAKTAGSNSTTSNEIAHDYGLVFKRSLGYNEVYAAHADASNDSPIPGQEQAESDNAYDPQTDGNPFAVFKLANPAVNGGGGNLVNGEIRDFNLENNHRSNVNEADLLAAMAGSFVVISGSHASGPKKFGLIKGLAGASGPDAQRIQIQVLGAGEGYGESTQPGSDIPLGEVNGGSIQLLNAFAGPILNKGENVFHMASAAITGSGDNKFISGSANILQYGGLASAKLQLFSNSIVSGSTERLSAEFDNSAAGNEMILKSLNSTDLVLSSSQKIKFAANDNQLVLPASFTQPSNEDLLTVNADGEISGVSRAAVVAGGSTLAKFGFKITQTIAADTSLDLDNTTAGVTSLPEFPTALAITKTDADLLKSLDVFVNGQLLVSGSADHADGDYSHVNASTLRFEFALEPDDIVQVIQN